MSRTISISNSTSCRLWIDRVGVYDLWFPATLTVGNAFVDERETPKLGLLADLRTKHTSIERTGDNYFVIPHGETFLDEKSVPTRQAVSDAALIKLGDDVELKLSRPSPLSASLLITFSSHHQPKHRSDGVVMFDRTCILGSNAQSHIPCANMDQTVVLFERDDQLWAKSSVEFRHSNATEEMTKMTLLTDGSILSGEDWQFRLEKGCSL